MNEFQVQVQRERAEAERQVRNFWIKVVVGSLLTVALLIGGAMWGLPKYKLYRADIEKRTLISEARAKADAAEYTAEAEVTKANYEAERDRIRAQGVADANATINQTLTPEFITWHYVDQLADLGDQIIYVPTEGGIPILESGRVGQGVAP